MSGTSVGIKPISLGRVTGLDTLRALAIILVMLWHLPEARGIHPALDTLVAFGWSGVDLFFVLSGYLIGQQLFRLAHDRPGKDLRKFYIRRAFRTLPAYWVVLAVFFLVSAVREKAELPELSGYLNFTANFKLFTPAYPSFVHVWSLCVEEQFYLIAPLAVIGLYQFFKKEPGAQRGLLFQVSCELGAITLLLVGVVLRYWIWHNQELQPGFQSLVSSNPGEVLNIFYRKIYFPTHTHMDGLILGVLLAATQRYRPKFWMLLMRRPWLLFSFGVAVLWTSLKIDQVDINLFSITVLYLMLAFGYGACVLAALHPDFWLSRVRIPGARLLADLAYSLYLSHKTAAFLFRAWEKNYPGLGTGTKDTLLVLWILMIAWLLHHLVEKPFLIYRDRITHAAPPKFVPTS